MTFSRSVLKDRARHRRWLRKTKGLRAHQGALARAIEGLRAHQAARASAMEASKMLDVTERFPNALAFRDYMQDKIGCGP